MTTFISFIKFSSIEEVGKFQVFDAQPEREDGQLGELNGTPVWPVYEHDDENDVTWVTATL